MQVALELAKAVEEGEGDPARVRLPVLQHSDAAALIGMMHGQLDEVIALRDAQIGTRMACHKGCNKCCGSPIVVSEGEVVAVVEWLREHPDVRARFDTAYGAWRDQVGELAGQPIPPDAEESRAYVEKVQARNAMCAFNHEGACTIYAVRPAICRKAHAIDTNANCMSLETPVLYYAHPETEETFESQRPMKIAIHHALRRGARLELLCSSVRHLLDGE
jgi:Fe-S-cluster containining protein